MATSNLGACEWFVWDLQRSNLIDRGQLDQVVGEFLKKKPWAEPQELAQFMVGEGILSQFQADRILEGKTQNLVLGPYILMDALGTGSMGTVYKAKSKNDNQWYAVKVLPRRSMWNVRIARRLVRTFEQCKHPSIVPFVDVGTSGGSHYLAWPLVEGVPLEAVVQQQTKLDPAIAAMIALQTAEGLNICHQQGLIHGLIKPSNLMIGADDQVRILDFGIGSLLAETEGESLVDTMSTANTLTSGLDCSSPESIMDPTIRTQEGDQYSLGCVIYFCLTGQYPFPEGTAVDKMMAHQMKQPTPIRDLNPDVPAELAALVERLMQKKPEDRFGSWADFIDVLRPLVESAPAPKMPPISRVVPPRPVAPPVPPPAAVGNGQTGEEEARPAPRPAASAVPKAASPEREVPRPVAPPSSRPTPPPPPPPPLPSRDVLRKAAPPVRPSPPPTQEKPREAEEAAGTEPAPTKTTKNEWTMIVLAVLVGVITFWLLQIFFKR